MRVQYAHKRSETLTKFTDISKNEVQAVRANVVRAIYAGIQLIAERPYAFGRSRDPDDQSKGVSRYRYKILCLIGDDHR